MRIESDRSLQKLHTFGIDVSARWLATLQSPEDLDVLRAEPLYAQQRRFVLGGGSNILFTRDFDGLVIRNAIPGFDVEREDESSVWVRAGAGEVWDDFVRRCIDRGWSGLENLSLIPGQVGAAPMQNIGAYGVEIESRCERVDAIHLETGERVSFARSECEFGYRDSVFKNRHAGRFLITGALFRLDKHPVLEIGYGDVRKTLDEMGVGELTVAAVREAIVRIRTAKLPDPKVLGNAGSFFKNPVVPRARFEELRAQYTAMPHYPQRDGSVKVPAGWLIEQCGWKGRVVGRAGVHDRQALVLVNHGGATGEEIENLAMDVRRSVLERFGIDLVPEVNVVR